MLGDTPLLSPKQPLSQGAALAGPRGSHRFPAADGENAVCRGAPSQGRAGHRELPGWRGPSGGLPSSLDTPGRTRAAALGPALLHGGLPPPCGQSLSLRPTPRHSRPGWVFGARGWASSYRALCCRGLAGLVEGWTEKASEAALRGQQPPPGPPWLWGREACRSRRESPRPPAVPVRRRVRTVQ